MPPPLTWDTAAICLPFLNLTSPSRCYSTLWLPPLAEPCWSLTDREIMPRIQVIPTLLNGHVCTYVPNYITALCPFLNYGNQFIYCNRLSSGASLNNGWGPFLDLIRCILCTYVSARNLGICYRIQTPFHRECLFILADQSLEAGPRNPSQKSNMSTTTAWEA